MFGFLKRWLGMEEKSVKHVDWNRKLYPDAFSDTGLEAKDPRFFLASDEEWVTPTEWFVDTDGKKVRKKRKKNTCCGGGCHSQVEEVPNQAFDPINPLTTLLILDAVTQESREEEVVEVQERVEVVDGPNFITADVLARMEQEAARVTSVEPTAPEPVQVAPPPHEPAPSEPAPICTYDPPSYSPPPTPSYDYTPSYSPPPPPSSNYGSSSSDSGSSSSDSGSSSSE